MNRSFYRMIHEKHLRNEKKKNVYIYIYINSCLYTFTRKSLNPDGNFRDVYFANETQ